MHRLRGHLGFDLNADAARRAGLRNGEPCDHPGCLSHVIRPCEGCGRVGGEPDSRPILVGEANPYGGDPAFALYPEPEHATGGRLCRVVLGLEPREYLRRFDRRNLCPTAWSLRAARAAAEEILAGASGRTVVLLGSKVCSAFRRGFNPFTVERDPGLRRCLVILPHPSGLCRVWNEPDAYERARRVLREAGVLA